MDKIIEWSDALAIDNGIIDNDHRYLIKLFNEFTLMSHKFLNPVQALEFIDRLYDYACVHFRREERLQKQIGFPTAAEHKLAHEELESNLAKIRNMIGHPEGGDLDLISEKASALLRKWLVTHIMKHDLAMRDYAEKINTASKDVASIENIAFV